VSSLAVGPAESCGARAKIQVERTSGELPAISSTWTCGLGTGDGVIVISRSTGGGEVAVEVVDAASLGDVLAAGVA
jgi:hypothetical protein